MNIELKRSDLLHALAAADGVARPSDISPLFECVLITATGGDAVTVAATDTAMTIRAKLESKNRKAGSLAMNAKRLRDVVKGAPGDTITLAALDNSWIEIKSGKAHYKLAALPGRDFPKIPESGKGTSVTFDGDVLKTLIDRVLFSASDDKTRMHLNGALFEVRSGVASMVSTDGHRLCRATCACDAADFSALVPKDALAKLTRLATGDVELVVERARLFASTSGVTMSTPLIDAKFPPIESLLELPRPHAITVNRAALIASIERTRIATTEARGMSFDTRDGSLVLSSSHPDVGEVSDEIEAKGATDKIKISVAPKYLLEPLARMSDEDVTLKLSDPLAPLTIEGATDSNYLALVMPMRRD